MSMPKNPPIHPKCSAACATSDGRSTAGLRLRARADVDVRPSLYGPVQGQPQYAGRQPFRNVAIANSDSEAFAYTHSAINEAYRAVQDLPPL